MILTIGSVTAAYAEENTAYVAGAVVGRLVASLLIAMVIRWLYVRIAKGGREVMHPWTFVIAAVIAVLSAAGAASG